VKVELLGIGELEPGELESVQVGSLQVVVVRKPDGTLSALRDRCPHRGATLSLGCLQPFVDGDRVGETYLTDRCVLQCPWHGFQFDVDTGRSVADPERERVRAYRVSVEDDHVFLEK
jgi:nitrite reductase/ring-hydroxylating ferredoxin subunit